MTITALLYLVIRSNYNQLTIAFLVPSLSFMPSNQDFSVIENRKCKTQTMDFDKIQKKSGFLKKAVFQIPFWKSHNLVNFWAGELRGVLFDFKFLLDFHTVRNSTPTEWDFSIVTHILVT